MAFADVTGDGSADPIVGTSDSALVRLAQCGNACFARAESVPLGSGAGAAALATADFNGDGIADVASASGASVIVFFGGRADNGRPEGLVAADAVTVATGNFQAVVAADLDGDGHTDVGLFGTGDGYQYSVALGDGHGHFSVPSQVAFYVNPRVSLRGFTVGDFNGDGISEVAITGYALTLTDLVGFIDVWSLGPGTQHYSANQLTLQAAAGDVDGDGRDDLAIVFIDDPDTPGQGASIEVFRSTGTSFTPISIVKAGGLVGSLLVHDVDGDGRADLLALDSSHGRFDWFQGLGGGHFFPGDGKTVLSHEAGPNPSAMALGNIGGRVLPDLIVSNPGEQFARVSYLANSSVHN